MDELDVDTLVMPDDYVLHPLANDIAKNGYVTNDFLGLLIPYASIVHQLELAGKGLFHTYHNDVHFVWVDKGGFDLYLGLSTASYMRSFMSSAVPSRGPFGDLSSLRGKNVVLTEDVVDTGESISSIVHQIERVNPASIQVISLIDKRNEHKRLAFDHPYVSLFSVPAGVFVVGFGIDSNDKGRELENVYVPSEQGKLKYVPKSLNNIVSDIPV